MYMSSSQGSSSAFTAPQASLANQKTVLNNQIRKRLNDLQKLGKNANVFSEMIKNMTLTAKLNSFGRNVIDKDFTKIVEYINQKNKNIIELRDRLKKLENKVGAAQGLVQMSTSGNKRKREGGRKKRKSRRKTRRKSRKRRRKKRRRKTKRKR